MASPFWHILDKQAESRSKEVVGACVGKLCPFFTFNCAVCSLNHRKEPTSRLACVFSPVSHRYWFIVFANSHFQRITSNIDFDVFPSNLCTFREIHSGVLMSCLRWLSSCGMYTFFPFNTNASPSIHSKFPTWKRHKNYRFVDRLLLKE